MGAKKYLRRVTMQLEQLIQVSTRTPPPAQGRATKRDRTSEALERLNSKVDGLGDRVEAMATRLDHLTEALTAMQATPIRQAQPQNSAGPALEVSHQPAQPGAPLRSQAAHDT